MPARWEARNPDYERAVRDTFAEQRAMALIGASITRVEPGFVEIELPFRDDLVQQHGILHGGVVGMVADSACAFAAMSVMPAEATGFTVEYKINMLRAAQGERILARGEAVSAGRTLAVARADVYAEQGGEEKLVATALETLVRAA